MHDRELGLDHLGEADGHLRPPGIRRDGDDVLPRQAEILEVAREERQSSHVVDRDREEALDLPGVQVHRQHAVGAGQLDHVGDQARRDRLTRLGLAVLARVREEWNHSRDALRRGELGGLDHEQQLHDVAVDGLGAGLDDEGVGASDRLDVAAIRLAVRERLQLDLAELDPELFRHLERQFLVRAAGEEHQPLPRPPLDEMLGARHRAGRTALALHPGQLCQLSRAGFDHRILPC